MLPPTGWIICFLPNKLNVDEAELGAALTTDPAVLSAPGCVKLIDDERTTRL
jgi:hypothetical protein